MTRQGEYMRRGFHGAVVVTDWAPRPDGGSVSTVVGTVDVLEDKELLGFPVNDRDSKWGVRVAGPSGTVVVVPGCKVRLVYVLPEGQPIGNADFWVLP